MAVLSWPKVFLKERLKTNGRVVVAGGVSHERTDASGCVVATGSVGVERTGPGGCVVAAGGVPPERFDADGRILATGGVSIERLKTGGRVVVAGGVGVRAPAHRSLCCRSRWCWSGAHRPRSLCCRRRLCCDRARQNPWPCCRGPPSIVKERLKTNGRVVHAGCEAEEGIRALSRVAVGITSVRCWNTACALGKSAKTPSARSIVVIMFFRFFMM